MVIKATIIKVLFAEMYVNDGFCDKMFVQRSEFNSGQRIALYKDFFFFFFSLFFFLLFLFRFSRPEPNPVRSTGRQNPITNRLFFLTNLFH